MWRTLPQQGIRACIVAHDSATCGSTLATAESVRDPLRLAQQRDRTVPFIDPVDAFCGTAWCPGVIGNVAVYADDDYATATYLGTAMPWVRQHIGTVVAAQVALAGG